MDNLTDTLNRVITFLRSARSIGDVRRPIAVMPLPEALVEDRQGIGEQVTLNGSTVAVFLGWNRSQGTFENVADNALRYGDCADIEVHHERDSEGREWLYIDFRDNGPGIPEEKPELVLELCVRLETSCNRKTGRYELGLSIVRNLVEANGGRVFLMNRSEGGPLARMLFPL